MVRNLIRNQAPGNRLRVRIPCPPLIPLMKTQGEMHFARIVIGQPRFLAWSLRIPFCTRIRFAERPVSHGSGPL